MPELLRHSGHSVARRPAHQDCPPSGSNRRTLSSEKAYYRPDVLCCRYVRYTPAIAQEAIARLKRSIAQNSVDSRGPFLEAGTSREIELDDVVHWTDRVAEIFSLLHVRIRKCFSRAWGSRQTSRCYRGVFRVGSESYCQHRQGQGSPSASCSSPCCRGFGSFASRRISFERNPPRHGSRPMAAGSNRERVRTVVLALLGLLFFATAIGAVVGASCTRRVVPPGRC